MMGPASVALALLGHRFPRPSRHQSGRHLVLEATPIQFEQVHLDLMVPVVLECRFGYPFNQIRIGNDMLVNLPVPFRKNNTPCKKSSVTA